MVSNSNTSKYERMQGLVHGCTKEACRGIPWIQFSSWLRFWRV